MKHTLLIATALMLTTPAIAQEHDHHDDHATHQHDDHDHQQNDHTDHSAATETDVYLSRTDDINAALDAGGEAIVVEVLGVVCDFCAKAMNRTFGRREDVAAVYVDLDTKTLNLVLTPGASMSDQDIDKVVERSGYKIKTIHRGEQILRGPDAIDPS